MYLPPLPGQVWDLRSRCCSPAVTLVGGREPLEAVALAAAQGGAGQLGAGLMCFAGGGVFEDGGVLHGLQQARCGPGMGGAR